MNLQVINEFITPVLLILAGILIKYARKQNRFGIFSKYWYILVILGIMNLVLKYISYNIK